jgi:hypothetical protein
LKEVAPEHHSACMRVQLGEIDLTPAERAAIDAVEDTLSA